MVNPKAKTWCGIIGSGVIAIVWTAVTAYFAIDATLLSYRGTAVMATCTKVTPRRSNGGASRSTGPTYHVSYPVGNKEIRTGVVDPGFTGLGLGKTIEVLYDPQKPSRVQANRFLSLWGFVLLFGGAEVSFLIVKLQRRETSRRS